MFGESVFEPATGWRERGFLHVPVEVQRPTGDTAHDARIRQQYTEGEGASAALFNRIPAVDLPGHEGHKRGDNAG